MLNASAESTSVERRAAERARIFAARRVGLVADYATPLIPPPKSARNANVLASGHLAFTNARAKAKINISSAKD